jgi:hypothetical protein
MGSVPPERVAQDHQPVEWVPGEPYLRHVKMGRPNKLSQEVGNTVLDALRKGVSVVHAAGLAGIGESTVRTWRDLGEADPDGPYGDFARAFKAARALHVEREMIQIGMGVDKWQSSAWSLERNYPNEYALKKDNSPMHATFLYGAQPPPMNEDLPPEALEEE